MLCLSLNVAGRGQTKSYVFMSPDRGIASLGVKTKRWDQ